jgi:hypothetical protein
MTIGYGFVNGKTVFMACDHATTWDDGIPRLGGSFGSKIVRIGNFLIGASGLASEAAETVSKLSTTDLIGDTLQERRQELLARFDGLKEEGKNRRCSYLVGHKGALYKIWSDAVCTTAQFDFIGTDVILFNRIRKKLIDKGLNGQELAKQIVLASAMCVEGVDCEPEGPTIMSI